MKPDGKPIQGEDIKKIREDVLKQCTASLAAFIGGLRYSDSVHVSTEFHRCADAEKTPGARAQPRGRAGATLLFDTGKLTSAVAHANSICRRYGVEVLAINIVSAFPADKRLNDALSKGATAAAQAEQAETAVEGNAKALLIKANAEA